MKRFIPEQNDEEFHISHSGLALFGACINRHSDLFRHVGRLCCWQCGLSGEITSDSINHKIIKVAPLLKDEREKAEEKTNNIQKNQ